MEEKLLKMMMQMQKEMREGFEKLNEGILQNKGNIHILENKMNMGFKKVDEKFENMEKRFDKLEIRFDGLETKFDRLDTRFDGLEPKFTRLESKLDMTHEVVVRHHEHNTRQDMKYDELKKDVDNIKAFIVADSNKDGIYKIDKEQE